MNETRWTLEGDAQWMFRRSAGLSLEMVETEGQQKRIAHAIDRNKGLISKLCSGERKTVMERFGDLAVRVALDNRTDVGYLLAYVIMRVEEALSELPEDELSLRFDRALRHETLAQLPADMIESEYWRGTAGIEELIGRMLDHDAALRRCIVLGKAIVRKLAREKAQPGEVAQ